jgi:hypothetical protein
MPEKSPKPLGSSKTVGVASGRPSGHPAVLPDAGGARDGRWRLCAEWLRWNRLHRHRRGPAVAATPSLTTSAWMPCSGSGCWSSR